MLRDIQRTKMAMSSQASEAFFSLSQAQYAAGDFRHRVIESVTNADFRVENRIDNVAGVKLPVFTEIEMGQEQSDNLGLAGGGGKIQNCREKFRALLSALVKLASLQTSFVTLDEALKVTNRRVNALDNVIPIPSIYSVCARTAGHHNTHTHVLLTQVTIPRIEKIISYILRELDELEREDFVRIKKVQANKDEERKLAEAQANKTPKVPTKRSSSPMPSDQDILAEYEPSADVDVVF